MVSEWLRFFGRFQDQFWDNKISFAVGIVSILQSVSVSIHKVFLFWVKYLSIWIWNRHQYWYGYIVSFNKGFIFCRNNNFYMFGITRYFGSSLTNPFGNGIGVIIGIIIGFSFAIGRSLILISLILFESLTWKTD